MSNQDPKTPWEEDRKNNERRRKRRPIAQSSELPDFVQTERKKPKVIKKNKLSLMILVCAFLTIVIVTCVLTFLWTNKIFNIKDHDITGITYSAPGSVDKIAKSYHGNNIFRFNKKKMRKEYLIIREIDDVQIKRKLPNKIIIKIIEKKPVCCFKTPSGKYLITNSGLIYHKMTPKEKLIAIPTVVSNNNKIVLGMNIKKDLIPLSEKNKDKTHKRKTGAELKKEEDILKREKTEIFQTLYLYELARICYNNKIGISSIQLKNNCEVILISNNNIIIKFGATADLLDKSYLLKEIFLQKKGEFKKIKEITILNFEKATIKYKQS
ncbi:MAG: FtsQ-type POTRA domain-containing protein [Abditibacteriota bacterium]|nr:FtsQ-type POTRA domain-containing protein [Abditibacteriota bacterium]